MEGATHIYERIKFGIYRYANFILKTGFLEKRIAYILPESVIYDESCFCKKIFAD